MMTRRILVVEDDSDTVIGLQNFFKAWGFDVEIAYNGEEALESLREDLQRG